MTSFDHLPEFLIDIIVNASEYLCRNHMSVVICPPSQDTVDLFDEGNYRRIRRVADQVSDFSDEGEGALFGGSDVELIAVFPKSLAEEVESVFNVNDFGFLL